MCVNLGMEDAAAVALIRQVKPHGWRICGTLCGFDEHETENALDCMAADKRLEGFFHNLHFAYCLKI